MHRDTFEAVVAEIEKIVEGEGYFIDVHLTNGSIFNGGWSWAPEVGRDMLKLDPNNGRPAWFGVHDIVAVELSDQ